MATIESVRGNAENVKIQQQLDKIAQRKKVVSSIVPFLGLAFVLVFFQIVTKGIFLGADNIGNLINQSFVLCLIAVGSAFVYAHGGMDFSISSVSGVAQLFCGMLLVSGVPLPICLLVCVLTSIIGALCTSSIALQLGVPVFVGSLCVRTSFTGLLKTLVEESEIAINYQQYAYMNSTAVKAVILVAVTLVAWYLFNYTTIGKFNKAIGGNARAAEQAGVPRKKTIYTAYIIMGICVGIASIFAFFRTGKVTSQSGSGYEFNVMMAIILGGFPMNGGDKCRISGAIVGALTVTLLSNGLLLWGLDATIISGIKGLLFVVIVALSYDRSNGKLVS